MPTTDCIIKLQGPGQRTPPLAARPRSPRRTGPFLERRAGRGSWPATPRSDVGARSSGAGASAARRRDVWSPTRSKLGPRSQVSTGGRNTHRGTRLRAGRRPSCKGSMPFFKTKRAMAMMGKTNACKKPKLEPDEPPPQSMKRCRFIDCGEASRVRLAAAARGRDQAHAAARPVRLCPAHDASAVRLAHRAASLVRRSNQ